ncbi:hypothetical protein NIES2107_04000 [Nostoc carneum NIES-2107]|nr:hypothetical protein NIES2107_04000 [Nostoc carneum NIES-2107]
MYIFTYLQSLLINVVLVAQARKNYLIQAKSDNIYNFNF